MFVNRLTEFVAYLSGHDSNPCDPASRPDPLRETKELLTLADELADSQ
jgi:hypothetical protein